MIKYCKVFLNRYVSKEQVLLTYIFLTTVRFKMIFDDVLELMKTPNKKALDKSLADCHVKGCFSLVVGGEEDESGELQHGTLTRIFIATKKISPFDIQFHSHRYPLTIGVINGCFEHHLALPYNYSESTCYSYVTMKEYKYTSPLNGGIGLTSQGEATYSLKSYSIPVGGEIYLDETDIHTVSVSKGSIWIVKEHGFASDSSVVLGTSFQTDGLYNPPQQFQVNDVYTLVYDKLKKLV